MPSYQLQERHAMITAETGGKLWNVFDYTPIRFHKSVVCLSPSGWALHAGGCSCASGRASWLQLTVAQATLLEVWHNSCFMTTPREWSNGSDPTNQRSRSSCTTHACKQLSTPAQHSHAMISPHVNGSSSANRSLAGFVEAKRRARVL